MINSGGLLHANSKDAKKNCSDALENGDYQFNRINYLISTEIAHIVCLYWATFLLGWLCNFLIQSFYITVLSLYPWEQYWKVQIFSFVMKSCKIISFLNLATIYVLGWLYTMFARAQKFREHSRLFNAILIMSLWIRMLFRILLGDHWNPSHYFCWKK